MAHRFIPGKKKAAKNTKKKPVIKKKVTKPKEVIVDERQLSRDRTYTTTDSVLPSLELPSEVPIEISITDASVTLRVGPRDWEWGRWSGQFIGCGTTLTETVVEEMETEAMTPSAPDASPIEGVVESDTEQFEEDKPKDEVTTDPLSTDDEKLAG